MENIKLQDCPKEFKKWKKLGDYRMEINSLVGASNLRFLESFSLIEKISEQLMCIDYLISLELWLKPFSVIGKRHKSIYIQQIASIYEVLLELLLNSKLEKITHIYPIINSEVLNRGYNTLGTLTKKFKKAKIFTDKQIEYLENLSEYRNLMHLSKEQMKKTIEWADNQDTQNMRNILDVFIKDITKKIRH